MDRSLAVQQDIKRVADLIATLAYNHMTLSDIEAVLSHARRPRPMRENLKKAFLDMAEEFLEE